MHIWQSDAHYVEMRDRTLNNTKKERERERKRETAVWNDGPSRYTKNKKGVCVCVCVCVSMRRVVWDGNREFGVAEFFNRDLEHC